jgi:hypothetical protein
LGAAAALVATGTALAVVQPGDLGDETAAPAQETTTTTVSPDLTTTTTIAVTTTTTADSTTSTTAGGGATTTTIAGGTTTTTLGGSGIGQGGTPNGGADGVADTGGESMIGAGMALGAIGLLLRRAARPRSA